MPEVISHWYVPIPDFQSTVGDFYDAVEAGLGERRVPGMDVNRILVPDGGMLSDQREYLRMRRERLVFDVCSAPFGTSWFFSCRYAEIPFKLRVWELLVLVGATAWIYTAFPLLFGFFTGTVLFAASLIGGLVLLDTFAASDTQDMDSLLLRLPVIGALYELFVRRNQSYYREDARVMYCHSVDAMVRSKIVEVCQEAGIEDVEFINIDPSQSEPACLAGRLIAQLGAGGAAGS